MVAFAAAMILGACTGNKVETGLDFSKATPEEVVSALAEKIQAGDATAIQQALETVQTQLSKLMEGADVAKVGEYAAKIQAFVQENAETLKGFNIDVTPLSGVLDQVKALPGAAEDVAADAVDAAQAEAESAVEGAIDAAEGAVDEAVEAGKKAVNDAVEAGQKAASDAAAAGQKAVDDSKAKANQAIQDAADKIKL